MQYRAILAAFWLSLPCLGSVVTYTDATAWSAAASAEPNVLIETETFANNKLHTPELSIATYSGMGSVSQSGNGVISGGMWTDCVGKNACNSKAYDITMLTFTKPVYAFGGDWDMSAGSGLEIYAGGSQDISPNQSDDQGRLTGSAFDGFFGFVSQSPFTWIMFASSTGEQSFTLSDAVMGIDPPPSSAVPEPASLALLGIAGVALGLARKRLHN